MLNSSSTSQQGSLRSHKGRKLKGATSIDTNYQQQFEQYVPTGQFLSGNLVGNSWNSVPVRKKKLYVLYSFNLAKNYLKIYK